MGKQKHKSWFLYSMDLTIKLCLPLTKSKQLSSNFKLFDNFRTFSHLWFVLINSIRLDLMSKCTKSFFNKSINCFIIQLKIGIVTNLTDSQLRMLIKCPLVFFKDINIFSNAYCLLPIFESKSSNWILKWFHFEKLDLLVQKLILRIRNENHKNLFNL